jgi:integrase/recombinase XerC
MADYALRTRRPPRTLTEREINKLLKVTGEHRDGFRDHVIYSLALGCGLRESEIVALNVGDVFQPSGKPKRIIQLREFKRAGLDADPNDHRVHVPDATWYKLAKFYKATWATEMPADESPIFIAKKGNRSRAQAGHRLTTRGVRGAFRVWQQRAGFDVLYPFHTLRHTAISRVRAISKDIRIAQRFARHKNVATTVIYDHPSDEEVFSYVRKLKA